MSSGVSRIERAFAAPGALFMPYMTLGYPDYQTSLDLVQACAENGAGLMELGIPFSDPLADGPTIQHSTQVALEGGMTVRHSLEAVRELRQRGVTIPFVFMSYFNPILAYGLEAFVQEAAESADGLLIPDLPPDEAQQLIGLSRDHGLALVFMLSPNSTAERIRLSTEQASGFAYLVSVLGITGARDTLPPDLEAFIQRVRSLSARPIPLAVGFGISSPAQARLVARAADGVIVGSALIKAVEAALADGQDPRAAAGGFVYRMRERMG
jgi:tryptophan synthase alpha chain